MPVSLLILGALVIALAAVTLYWGWIDPSEVPDPIPDSVQREAVPSTTDSPIPRAHLTAEGRGEYQVGRHFLYRGNPMVVVESRWCPFEGWSWRAIDVEGDTLMRQIPSKDA